ncbi:MAG: 2'-5' RNA ligase family protein [Bifidobacteriaceae bacterium]|nr:2'-5' RNA ligase family protein [Bifidobacteriaceae bacterium]
MLAPAATSPCRDPGACHVGVVVAIPEPWATQLRAARASYGDPQADQVPPHVTLVPPTRVETANLAAVEEFIRDACRTRAAFTMHLRGTATFRPVSPVVHIQVVRGVSDCEQLERVLLAGPLAQELSFPYHPHVTVAQGVPDATLDRAFADLARFEAVFPVRDICLFTQQRDGTWHAASRIALTGP